MEGSECGIDELRHFFLAENRGEAMSFLWIRSVRNAPRLLERLDVEKSQRTEMVGHCTG